MTDTVAVIEGTGLDVMFAGDLCRLDVYTRAGVHKVTLPLHVFIEKARGVRDANGNPFPALLTRRTDEIERELAQDVAARPVQAVLSEKGRRRRRAEEEARQLYLAAEVDYRSGPDTRKQVAERHRINVGTWTSWVHNHARECKEAVAAARPPVFKSGGKLL